MTDISETVQVWWHRSLAHKQYYEAKETDGKAIIADFRHS